MSWLVGLTGLGAIGVGAFWLLGGMKILDILSPLLKGVAELATDFALRLWSGFKWMLGSSDGIIFVLTSCFMVWLLTTCPEATCTKASSAPKSVIGKTSPSTNSNDTFLDWFRLH